MSELKTQLSVQQIQLALRNSDLFDRRKCLIVPNVSWGMLPYEADLLAITPSGKVTEIEIKRSLSDLKADFRKEHRHDAGCVSRFFYCVPECLADQAKAAILDHERAVRGESVTEKDCPALLAFTEDGRVWNTGFGTAGRAGDHRISDADLITAGRLASLRYWDLLERTAAPEDRGLQKRLRDTRDELRVVKQVLKTVEEDFDLLRRFLRRKHRDTWIEFVNADEEELQ